jgi:hypothetical protein
MMIKTRVFDEFGVAKLRCVAEVDSASVIETAQTLRGAYRQMGVVWLFALLGLQGEGLVELMRLNISDDRRTVILTEMAVSAFLIDTLFGGVSPRTFLACDLSFVIEHDNAITFQKLDRASLHPENRKCQDLSDGRAPRLESE